MKSKTVRIIGISVFFITGALFAQGQSSGQNVRPILIQPGMSAQQIRPAIYSNTVISSAKAQDDTVELTPGVAVMGSIPAPASGACLLAQTQFKFVPKTSMIDISLTSDQNLDLYVRAGQRIAVEDGKIVADLSSVTPTGIEGITIENADPETTYFIAINNCSTETATFTITVFEAVVDPPPPPFISIDGCRLRRRATGGFALVIRGSPIRVDARVTINGEEPNKVRFKKVFNGIARRVVVKGNVCRFLPGIIRICNPSDGASSQPFACLEVCPN